MPAADLVAQAGLYGGVLIVDVVKLDLNDLDLRVLGKYLLKYLGPVVEGDAEMLYLALRLKLERRFVCAAGFELLKCLL